MSDEDLNLLSRLSQESLDLCGSVSSLTSLNSKSRISQESVINLCRSTSSLAQYNSKSTQASVDKIDDNKNYDVILSCWIEDKRINEVDDMSDDAFQWLELPTENNYISEVSI